VEESTSGVAGTLKQEIVTVWVRVGLRGFSTIDIETRYPPVPFFTGAIETVSPSSLVSYESPNDFKLARAVADGRPFHLRA
jgi:hypothetical protein